MSARTRPLQARPRPASAIEGIEGDVAPAPSIHLHAERRPGPAVWTPVAGAVAAAWALAALLGPVTVGTVELTPAAAAAAAATALLAGVSPPARGVVAMLAGVVALVVLPGTVAWAASGADARPLGAVVTLLVLAGATYGGRDTSTRLRAAALAGAGLALIAATLASTSEGTWRLAPATTIAAMALTFAGGILVVASSGTVVAIAALRPLLATGLLCGLVGAATLPGPGIPMIAGACAIAVATVRPQLGLALLAIAAGALPVGQPAAAVIAAGAVLATTIDLPAAGVLALPGAVALVLRLAEPGPVGTRAVLAVALIGVAVIVGRSVVGEPGDDARRAVFDVEVRRAPALVAAAWFLLAPGSWSWAGDAGLRPYDEGMGRAIATAAIVLVGAAAWPAVRSRGSAAPRTVPAPSRPGVTET